MNEPVQHARQSDASISGVIEKPREGGGPAWTGPVAIRSLVLTGIFLILLLHTLRVAAPILIPITLACILNLLLSPIVRRMRRVGIAEPIGAAFVMLVFWFSCFGGLYGLSVPAEEWMQRAPLMLGEIKDKLRPLSEPLKEAREAAETVTQLASMGDGQVAGNVTGVAIDTQGWLMGILSSTPKALANITIVVVLLYFLLATGDSFLNKLVTVIPRFRDKKRAVSIVRDIQRDISHYLVTRTLINAGLGVTIALALYLLGMPNPVLWGVLSGIFNFAPYIGPAASIAIITVVAILSLDSIGQALLVPLAVFAINTIEGQVLSPHIIGQRLALSPVVIFTSIVFWGWLWGLAGALLAISLIAALNVVCQRIQPLNPVADFIGIVPRPKPDMVGKEPGC